MAIAAENLPSGPIGLIVGWLVVFPLCCLSRPLPLSNQHNPSFPQLAFLFRSFSSAHDKVAFAGFG
jgi:hypothetical protein